MRASRVAVVAALLLLGVVAAEAKDLKARVKMRGGEQKRVFALFGDWGRTGGIGASAFKPNFYDPKMANACPSKPDAPFYTSIDPKIDPSNGPYDKFPDDKCVVDACGTLTGDSLENCEGKIQQLQAAYQLQESCAARGCEFIINTSDNFYIDGCNSTAHASGATCATRFQTDWTNVYQTPRTPALRDLVWYGSLGNHDILGYTEGVDSQIMHSELDSRWVLPARWYARTIGSGPTAINLIVAHTSVFVDKYLKASSKYSVLDEERVYSSPENRAIQLDFLEKAMIAASKKEGWMVVMGHHPAFGGSKNYFADDVTGLPESAAWGKFSDLVKKYKPVAYVNGHDHVLDHSASPDYLTQFFTTGAGSYTEAGDGGYDVTTGKVDPTKTTLKYSNVRMSDGASWVGNMISTVTPTTFTTEMFSIRTGTKSEFKVVCTKTKSKKAEVPFTCTRGPGQVAPAYSKV